MRKRMQGMAVMVVGTALLLAAAGCGGGSGSTPPGPGHQKSLSLVSYQSCGELESEIKAILVGEMEANADNLRWSCRYKDGGGSIGGPAVPASGGAEGGDMASAGGSAMGATSTNVQEAGVDEADLLKTDNQIAYAIVGSEVEIIRVRPYDQFGLLATITPAGMPNGLYLADGKLIILSFAVQVAPLYEQICPDIFPPPPGCGGGVASTVIEEVYDVANPAAPALLKKREYSGTPVDSRRIGSKLALVVNGPNVAYPALSYELDISEEELPECEYSYSSEPSPNAALAAAIERLKEKNRATIAALSLAQLMPEVGDGKELACSDIARSPSAAGLSLLSVVMDAYADPAAAPARTALMSSGGAVYASTKALYVTASAIPYEWWTWWTREIGFEDATLIHRFAIDSGAPVYTGTGKVAGHLLDNGYAGSRYSTRFSMAQFAMSEYEGFLRIASTVDAVWSEAEPGVVTETLDGNRVTVLDAGSPSLEKVGEVAGFGGGEEIRAVRFIGARGYVVTFQQTDPLFVIDLAAPSAPVVAGELVVPGFSTYLHPLDEGHLIGLGFGAAEEGPTAWTQGLKLALFDVTDASAPAEVNHRELGTRGSYSPAVEEHHAFTLDPLRGYLALPVDLYEGSIHSFTGVMLLRADLTGTFATVGRIAVEGLPASDVGGWMYESSGVLRTAIVGDGVDDGVVTLTTQGVMENRIDATMSQVGIVGL